MKSFTIRFIDSLDLERRRKLEGEYKVFAFKEMIKTLNDMRESEIPDEEITRHLKSYKRIE